MAKMGRPRKEHPECEYCGEEHGVKGKVAYKCSSAMRGGGYGHRANSKTDVDAGYDVGEGFGSLHWDWDTRGDVHGYGGFQLARGCFWKPAKKHSDGQWE